MKFVMLTIMVCLVVVLNSNGQINNVKLLVSKNESEVVTYLDSLNRIKSNRTYVIKRSVLDNGSLMLKCYYSEADQPFYKFLSVYFIFQRVKGEELCISQMILGYAKYVESNLNFIKDNFSYVSKNKWVSKIPDSNLKIEATLKIEHWTIEDYYNIEYSLNSNDAN